MIIRRVWPLVNDHLEGLAFCKFSSVWTASCKWSSRGAGLLQMIIWRIQPLANDHPEDPPSCKWSSGGTGHLQMIIQRILPLANDHLEDLASYKWSSGGTGLLQIIIRRTDFSRTICSCLPHFFSLMTCITTLFQFQKSAGRQIKAEIEVSIYYVLFIYYFLPLNQYTCRFINTGSNLLFSFCHQYNCTTQACIDPLFWQALAFNCVTESSWQSLFISFCVHHNHCPHSLLCPGEVGRKLL